MKRTKRFPGPSVWMAYANVRGFLYNRAEFMAHLQRQYGDLCRFRLGFFDVYFINKPELVKEVLMDNTEFVKTPAMKFMKVIVGNGLLVSGGEFHRRQRRLIQPAFRPERVRGYADVMTTAAQVACARWEDGQELDLHEEMMQLTMEIAAITLFGTSVTGLVAEVKEAIATLLPMMDRIAQPTGLIRMLLPSPGNLRLYRARRTLNRVIGEIIQKGRAREGEVDDVLSMLLNAQDEEGDGTGMTDEQVRSEVMTMFVAGHETTAVALSWTWHLLGTHPEVAARLHEELESVLEGRAPTAEDVPRLAYTRMVIAESMRLYPPAYLMDRLTTRKWRVGDRVIPKGKYIFMSPYTMHRHPDYFPDPERFLPERWTPELVAERPKFSYFPFGGGPRVCIGEQFAWSEMILVLAAIAQKWSFSPVSGHTPEVGPLITLRPKDGIKMIAKCR